MIGLTLSIFFNCYLKTDSQIQIKECEQFTVQEMIMRSPSTHMPSIPTAATRQQGNESTASGQQWVSWPRLCSHCWSWTLPCALWMSVFVATHLLPHGWVSFPPVSAPELSVIRKGWCVQISAPGTLQPAFTHRPQLSQKTDPCLLAHICGATFKTRKTPGFIHVLLKPWAIACAEWAPGNHVLRLSSLRNKRLCWLGCCSKLVPPSLLGTAPCYPLQPQPRVPQGDF